MFFIVLNEEALPEPYESAKEASEAAERLARELEAIGKPARWFISAEPKGH